MPESPMLRALILLLAAVGAGVAAQPQATVPTVTETATTRLTTGISYSGTGRGVLDVAEPKAGGTSRPAVLVLHGREVAPFRTGERSSTHGWLQHLAARGFVAATVTYRLAPGSQFPAAVQDVNGAIRFLKANAGRFGIDGERICVTGVDAGGTLAMLAALAPGVAEFQIGGPARDQSTRVACAAAIGAPLDFAALAGADTFLLPDLMAWLGGTPAGAPGAYAKATAANWASPDAPPVLLVHGAMDGLVPSAHAEALAARLVSLRAHAEVEILPGVSHTPTDEQRRLAWSRVDRFLDQYIGQPASDTTIIVADHGPRRQVVAMAWPSGRELWTLPNAGGHDVQPLPNGHVLFTMGPEKKVVEVNGAREVVWTYGLDEGLEHPISAERLANGNTLIGDAQLGKVIEVTPGKQTVWQYADADLGNMRMRNSRRTAAGTTLIAVEAAGKIIEVNSAGAIIWTYEGVGGARRRPYRAIRLPNNNTLITFTSPGELVEVTPGGSIVRSVGGAESDLRLIWASGMDLFPGTGRILLSDYLGRRLLELRPDGTVVHELRMPTRTTASVAVVR